MKHLQILDEALATFPETGCPVSLKLNIERIPSTSFVIIYSLVQPASRARHYVN